MILGDRTEAFGKMDAIALLIFFRLKRERPLPLQSKNAITYSKINTLKYPQ